VNVRTVIRAYASVKKFDMRPSNSSTIIDQLWSKTGHLAPSWRAFDNGTRTLRERIHGDELKRSSPSPRLGNEIQLTHSAARDRSGGTIMKRGITRVALAAGLVMGVARAAVADFPTTSIKQCGADAVVEGTVCLDRYEASVWRVPNPTVANGSPSCVYPGPKTRPHRQGSDDRRHYRPFPSGELT
jgi:hypothetical protein